jgi:hypothetical protein
VHVPRRTPDTGQLDLLAGEELEVDPGFTGARRIQLDATSWVEHVPAWLHGSEQLLASLPCVVPVLSLGSTRRFLLKSRTGGRSVVLAPASGDLVVTGGRCQRDWRHCVPKQSTSAGMRISVNFSSRLQATRA